MSHKYLNSSQKIIQRWIQFCILLVLHFLEVRSYRVLNNVSFGYFREKNILEIDHDFPRNKICNFVIIRETVRITRCKIAESRERDYEGHIGPRNLSFWNFDFLTINDLPLSL